MSSFTIAPLTVSEGCRRWQPDSHPRKYVLGGPATGKTSAVIDLAINVIRGDGMPLLIDPSNHLPSLMNQAYRRGHRILISDLAGDPQVTFAPCPNARFVGVEFAEPIVMCSLQMATTIFDLLAQAMHEVVPAEVASAITAIFVNRCHRIQAYSNLFYQIALLESAFMQPSVANRGRHVGLVLASRTIDNANFRTWYRLQRINELAYLGRQKAGADEAEELDLLVGEPLFGRQRDQRLGIV